MPDVVAQDHNPRDFLANRHRLFWLGEGRVEGRGASTIDTSVLGSVRQLEPTTGKISMLTSRDVVMDLKAVDDRNLLAVTSRNELISFDLTSQVSRTVLHERPELPLLFSTFALVGDRIYFTLGPNPFFPPADPGLFRVSRSGAGPAEHLGTEATEQTSFRVAGGFVYWKSPEGMKRRRLGKTGPVDRATNAPPPPETSFCDYAVKLGQYTYWPDPESGLILRAEP